MRRLIVGAIAVMVLASTGTAFAQVNPEENQVEFWCDSGGVKYEPVDTPFIVPEPPEGKTWTLLVLKGGTTNEVIPLPVVGQGYSHSAHDNSHVILCWEDEEVTTTTTAPTTTTTSPTTTTTTTRPSTTTTSSSTTTTVPVTTTSSSTTTTDPTTTTTKPVTTTSNPTTTSVVVTTTDPPTTTTVTVPTTLPVTGPSVNMDLGWLALFALALIVLAGAALVAVGRRDS